MDPRSEVVPHPAQQAFLSDDHRFVLAAAGAQSGKTIATAAKFAERIRQLYNARVRERRKARPLVNAWVVTPTYELATMPQRYLRERWPNGWRRRVAGIFGECEPWPGCIVKFRSAEHPDKLVSEPVDALWLNETARMKPDAWRGGLRMRLNATGGWMIADTTPMGQNWVYSDLFVPALPPEHPEHDPDTYHPDYSAHVWHTADNPAVSREEVEHARRTLPAAYFAREYLADFSAFHGQVYPHFSKALVHAASPDEYPELILGVDWGYAPGHLGVILVVGIDRQKRRAAVLEEVCQEARTDDWWLSEFLRLQAKYKRILRAYCDPSAPDKLAFMRQRMTGMVPRISFREAKNAVRDGIMCVAELIGTGGLVVNVGCPVTVRQHLSYHWQDGSENIGGDWKEKPAKVDDDTCDASRYAIFSHLARVGISYA